MVNEERAYELRRLMPKDRKGHIVGQRLRQIDKLLTWFSFTDQEYSLLRKEIEMIVSNRKRAQEKEEEGLK